MTPGVNQTTKLNCKLGNISVHIHRKKPRKDTLAKTSDGKPTVSGEITDAIEAERARPQREIELLSSEEEKLNDLDLEHLGFKATVI